MANSNTHPRSNTNTDSTGTSASASASSNASNIAPGDKKLAERSTWASAVDSINPWAGSRSSTPVPREPVPPPPSKPANSKGDHSINPLYGLSARKYPTDCPPLRVQWFHAADVPKRKPQLIRGTRKKPEDAKPPAVPKKWVPFSPNDSRSIESSYQTVLEAKENDQDLGRNASTRKLPGSRRGLSSEAEASDKEAGTQVPVNEDWLFDVDIEKRELAPVYWLGPIYDVRRGSWFYQEGSSLRPCEENLAAQLEEGYLRCKPWLYPSEYDERPSKRRKINNWVASRLRSDTSRSKGTVTPKASVENLKAQAAAQADGSSRQMGPAPQPSTHRLFGQWMNSVATYQDSSAAWLNSDGVLSWVTSTVYERFAGGGYMSGIKVVRGYTEPGKAKTSSKDSTKDEKEPTTPTEASLKPNDSPQDRARKRKSAPPLTRSDSIDATPQEPPVENRVESRGDRLKQQLSSLIESENPDVDEEEEAVRRREEKEIQDDYNAPAGETQGREIEHLVLVTHGIGQLLGLRMESVNFVHDVNTFRKNIKSVYSTSEDLRALNAEIGGGPGNSRVQVLPVCWRHLLDFPKRQEEKRHEQDLGLAASKEEEEYPSLDDLTIEGAGFARSLISDLALDVLLYQSAYREQISQIVFREANKIYKLFIERNPGFKGKVHLLGHSLGSAIFFDILCRQREKQEAEQQFRNPLRVWPSEQRKPEPKDPRDLTFDFAVDDFYCLGSPIGLFQMLKGRTVSARHIESRPADSPFDADFMDDPFLQAPLTVDSHRVSPITGLPYSVSSPKVYQLFNVFYPSDPIAYRVEPLISPAMSTLKPQNLPYTKKGIFGAVGPQGISGIGAKVGQSMSGLWSSFSAGLASNLLNRSLGLTSEDVAKINASQQQHQQQQHDASPGAGTNVGAGVVSHSNSTTSLSQKAAERKRQLAEEYPEGGRKSVSGHDVVLLDDDLETLYSRFQKGRKEDLGKSELKFDDQEAREKWAAEENKAARLRREETKVRALNRNGRVDYSIQEGALDFNPLSTIASHLQYWGDEDVAHFLMSQLLSRKGRDTGNEK